MEQKSFIPVEPFVLREEDEEEDDDDDAAAAAANDDDDDGGGGHAGVDERQLSVSDNEASLPPEDVGEHATFHVFKQTGKGTPV